MSDKTILDLKKVGLEEKEAKVYVATLELGPSPVQKISVRAGVPRATTYLVLEDLKARGLITTFEKGKKTFFAAEPPQQLNDLVSNKAFEVQQQQNLLHDLIPELMLRGQIEKGSRPVVRYYEGITALKAFLRDVLAGEEKEVLGIFVHEDVERLFQRAGLRSDTVFEMRQKAKIKRRLICLWKEGKAPVHVNGEEGAIYLPFKMFPTEADITIKGNRVAFMPYSEPVRGVIIEDKAIAGLLRQFFNTVWETHKIHLTK